MRTGLAVDGRMLRIVSLSSLSATTGVLNRDAMLLPCEKSHCDMRADCPRLSDPSKRPIPVHVLVLIVRSGISF